MSKKHHLTKLFYKIFDSYWYLRFYCYVYIFTPWAARRMRRKPVINVIFVIAELGMWKTENLYQAMLTHPRFNPVLRVVPTPENQKAQQEVVEYLNRKGYNYRAIDEHTPLQEGFQTDIIFYQKPYHFSYYKPQRFDQNLNTLFCYLHYGAHDYVSNLTANSILHNIAWQYYCENKSCAEDIAKLMDNKGRNTIVTGTTFFDNFRHDKSEYRFPWKPQATNKKRIIYAPHFSILPDSYLKYGTFLENGHFILEMAHKYENEVQFVFKPHPLLQPCLYKYWGKTKTDAYYAAWENLNNGQVELGQYIDLFMTSDAMLHDCSSITIEYIATKKPVMYLLNQSEENLYSNRSTYAREAFALHVKGHSNKDIEAFIQAVIYQEDQSVRMKEAYCAKYLIPENGKMAYENIIDAILG